VAAALQHADDMEKHLRELTLMREGPARLAKTMPLASSREIDPSRSREVEYRSQTDGLEFALRCAHQLLATIYLSIYLSIYI